MVVKLELDFELEFCEKYASAIDLFHFAHYRGRYFLLVPTLDQYKWEL